MKRALTASSLLVILCLSAGSVVAAPSRRQTGLSGTIAFERYQTPANSETYGLYAYIVSMSVDGSGERTLTTAGFDDERVPAWSPDGSTLAFTAYRGGAGHLYLVDRDGGGLRQITRGDDWWPSWSPDGKRVAFYRWEGTKSRLYTVRVDGTGLRALTDGAWRDFNAAWSPDGKWIAFSREDPSGDRFAGWHIWAVRPDGTGLRRLTAGRLQTWRPAWSPNGKWMAFGGWYTEDYEGDVITSKSGAIYVMPAEGGKPRRVTSGEFYDMEPCWSPDSKRIAFTRTVADLWLYPTVPAPAGYYTNYSAPADIYTVKLDGSGLVQVTNTPVSEEGCSWTR